MSAFSLERQPMLLPHVVDQIAKEHPTKTFAEVPNNPDMYGKGFRAITYKQLVNAIDGLAAWIVEHLGTSSTFETLVYFGPHDPMYPILVLATVKTGHKVLFPSPAFPALGLKALIGQIGAKAILSPEVVPPSVTAFLAATPMAHFKIPDLKELLDTPHHPYGFNKTFNEAQNEPLVVLHTSGSTGFPKPNVWTHGWAHSYWEETRLSAPKGFETIAQAAHLFTCLLYPLFDGGMNVYHLPAMLPTAANALESARHANATVIALLPSQLEQITVDPSMVEELSDHTEIVLVGGGNISDRAGDAIGQRAKLVSPLGSTETGLWPMMKQSDQDHSKWRYVQPHPRMNMVMEQREGVLHEALIKRNKDDYIQPVFNVFPELEEYRTGDLFLPHPNSPGLWKYYGRSDDMIVFASGHKFHPLDAESFLCKHKEIAQALIIGTGRKQAVLLLQLASGTTMEDNIWQIVEKMNDICHSYAKVTRDHILVTKPEKAMIITGKGTVLRKATIDAYLEELNGIVDQEI